MLEKWGLKTAEALLSYYIRHGSYLQEKKKKA
jgi:hypothetical protein